jgi:hypothetical protein
MYVAGIPMCDVTDDHQAKAELACHLQAPALVHERS